MRDRHQQTNIFARANLAAVGRLALGCLAFSVLSLFERPAAAANGTLLILQNPSNSSPRMQSLWGGGGSEQIIMKTDGSVWDWGANFSGELGNGTTNDADLPVQVLGPGGVGLLAPVAAIQGGELHNTALKANGTVWSWGLNAYGQLGDGSTNWGNNWNLSTTPVQTFGLTNVKSLGGRGYHTLALKNDGTTWSWGRNEFGELGIGVAYNTGFNGIGQATNVPVQVIGLTNPASLSGGGFFSLALMSNGTVMSWGENDHGECGDGTFSNRYTPVLVQGISNVVAISGGWNHALALRSDGTAWAWGNNPNGELGNGTTNNSSVPTQVVSISNVISVSSGDGNSMALRADGTVWKWGVNQYGELGNGTIDSGAPAHPLPLQVTNLSNIVIAVNRDYHNICVKRDGTVWVWGDNRYGGMGDLSGNPVLTPRLMSGLVSNNILPYAESFESYANGFSIVGTNFWSADSPASAIVIATNYSLPYNGPYPIPGPQQNVLQINGTVTNSFCPSFYSNLWADMLLQVNPSAGPLASLTNASFAIAVAPDGHLAVWNSTNAPSAGNGWTELLDAPVVTNQFCRVTIQANYAPDANGIFYYTVWVNGVASANPAARYAAADSSQPWFGQIVASGNFLLDDLVVSTNKTFYALQTEVAGYGGSVSPSGPLVVSPGSTNTFSIAASNWYSYSSLAIDGLNSGTPASFTYSNIQSDHSLVAAFAAILAANNTPEWWLYEQDTNWATNFNAAALSDPTGKGTAVWQDYIAGTQPLNPASILALNIAMSNGQSIVFLPTIATTPQYQLQRYYALETSTALSPTSWQSIAGWTNIEGLGPVLAYTNAPGNPNAFFRARVWLGP